MKRIYDFIRSPAERNYTVVTVSLGSENAGDAICSFVADICGEALPLP